MRDDQKFFRCELCGNFIGMIKDKGGPLTCCGQKMLRLQANTVEASAEKHLPDLKITGDTLEVRVGSTLHPMEEEHHIEFIYVQTAQGGQRKALKIDDQPTATFSFVDDSPLAVFEYCNIHGLWKTEVEQQSAAQRAQAAALRL